MVETLNSKESVQSSKNKVTQYTPIKLNFSAIENEEHNDAENLLKQLESTDTEPTPINVRNRPSTFWEKTWLYEGRWIHWGKNGYDNPYGKWRFISNDGAYILDWKWNINGIPTEGKLKLNWREFDIIKTYVSTSDKRKISRMICTGHIKWYTYRCQLDENFQISKITYAWVTINLIHEDWKTYLVNKNWMKLEYKKSHHGRGENIEHKDVDLAICKIVELISSVKNSGKILDEFERGNFGADIQADYKNQFLDEDLVDDWDYWTYWIMPHELVDWLNASRSDFGI